MLCLLIKNNKELYLPRSNNKDVKKMAGKHLLLYYTAIKKLKDNNLLIFGLPIIGADNYKSKCINKNKNNPKTAAKNLLSYYTTMKK